MRDEEAGLRIEEDLELVPRGSSCALIIRHADRDGSLNRPIGDDEGINALGAARAEALGRRLRRFRDIRFFSSPVGRCVDTCTHITAGFGRGAPIERTELLGTRAPLMVDPDEAYRIMARMGLQGFVAAYVSDELDRRVVMPCAAGTALVFRYAIERIEGLRCGVGVFCTHDLILTPTLARYFSYDFRAHGLVPFLDGLVLHPDGEGFRAWFAGRSVRVARDGSVVEGRPSEKPNA